MSLLDASETFGYDTAGRISAWSRTGFGQGSASYTFDAAGNLTAKTAGATTTAYSYNAGNQLTTETVGANVTTHSYDEFGRLTHSSAPAEETTYTYDALGHLSQIGSADATATYSYGISGMRERKSVTTPTGTRATESVYSGMQLLAERDSDGTTYEYVYGAGVPLELVVTPGPGLTGAGTPVRYAYQTDAGGSVIGITDASGAEIARYAYDLYGNPTATSGTDPLAARNPLRYRGYYWDAETGLYYLPARYYEPRSARFLSVDPAAPKASAGGTLNAYAYCGGNPMRYSDPNGEDILLGNYYPPSMNDQHEPDIPQTDAAPGGGFAPRRSGCHTLSSSGQQERSKYRRNPGAYMRGLDPGVVHDPVGEAIIDVAAGAAVSGAFAAGETLYERATCMIIGSSDDEAFKKAVTGLGSERTFMGQWIEDAPYAENMARNAEWFDDGVSAGRRVRVFSDVMNDSYIFRPDGAVRPFGEELGWAEAEGLRYKPCWFKTGGWYVR